MLRARKRELVTDLLRLSGFFTFTEMACRNLSRSLAKLNKSVCFRCKKVKPTDFTNDQLSELIRGEDGLLKEALKKGDLPEMVEIINAVGSILNYNGRQAAQKNLTESEAAEEKKSRDTRVEVCETYDDH